MEVAKALIRLLDGATHRVDIRHTRVHVQNPAAQFLDPFDGADSRADGIISRVAGNPCVPGFPGGEAGTPHQHQAGSVLFGQVF